MGGDTNKKHILQKSLGCNCAIWVRGTASQGKVGLEGGSGDKWANMCSSPTPQSVVHTTQELVRNVGFGSLPYLLTQNLNFNKILRY